MPYQKKNPVNPEKLFELYERGKTLEDLASLFSYTKTGIRYVMIGYDVARWQKLIKPEYSHTKIIDKETALKFFSEYESGLNLKELSKRHGYSMTHLRYVMIISDQERYNQLAKSRRGRPLVLKERNEKIKELVRQGKAKAEISERFKISSERIRQIVTSNP